MRSNWHTEELQKTILGYRETIAALEAIKENVRPWDRSELWWDQLETQIQHLKRSVASLEDYLGALTTRSEGPPSLHR
jgi:prefoldin subunit 5